MTRVCGQDSVTSQDLPLKKVKKKLKWHFVLNKEHRTHYWTYCISFIGILRSASLLSIASFSEGSRKRRLSPHRCNLAVRPALWMYVSASSGQSNCTTQFTAGKSATVRFLLQFEVKKFSKQVLLPIIHKTKSFIPRPRAAISVANNTTLDLRQNSS